MSPRIPETFAFRSKALNPLVTALKIALLALGFASWANGATLEPARLESREGYYQLTWQADQPVNLVESENPSFDSAISIYIGSDSGHVVSGKPNGTWYYRIESIDNGEVLSDTATITVSHHSLARAGFFFVLGASVFITTVALILLAKPDLDERA